MEGGRERVSSLNVLTFLHTLSSIHFLIIHWVKKFQIEEIKLFLTLLLSDRVDQGFLGGVRTSVDL
uniref:Uncharacterized protein n=1 Tax=Lepeophtheirus salmonis TaxID=72036 RepID=A0A0K2TUY8_LEPSM